MDSINNIWVVIFDMDGVIFESKNFWIELHQLYGTQKEALQLADRLMTKNYKLMAEITVQSLWRGKSAEPFWDLVYKSQYQPGVKEVFNFIKACGIKTAIVSSGPLQLAKRAQRELDIDEVRANEVIIKDGVINSVVEVNVAENEKGNVGLKVIEKLGGNPAMTIFVGDNDSDIPLAKVVGVSVAYDTESEKLKRVSKYVLAYGQLLELINIIKNEIATHKNKEYN